MMKKFIACLMAVALYALGTSVVYATLMDFQFDVTFDSGPLSGNTYTGEFTLAGVTGTGVETFDPTGAGGMTGTVEAFTLTVGTNTFDIQDAYDPSNTPFVLIDDGLLDTLYYETTLDTTYLLVLFERQLEGPPDNRVRYIDPIDTSGEDTQGYVSRLSPLSVPEPSILYLLGIGQDCASHGAG